jgi:hypothetical protein
MLFIFTGVIGFFTLFCFDVASLKDKLILKRTAFITGYSLLSFFFQGFS